jgi:hypothetical protein
MEYSFAAKRMVFVVGALSLLLMAGGALYFRSLGRALPFALGVLMSTALNLSRIYLLERTARKAAEIDASDAGKRYAQLQYLSRYMLTGAVLAAAALIPFVDLWGAIGGVLALQVAVIFMGVVGAKALS